MHLLFDLFFLDFFLLYFLNFCVVFFLGLHLLFSIPESSLGWFIIKIHINLSAMYFFAIHLQSLQHRLMLFKIYVCKPLELLSHRIVNHSNISNFPTRSKWISNLICCQFIGQILNKNGETLRTWNARLGVLNTLSFFDINISATQLCSIFL